MKAPVIYACTLSLMGAWGVYAARKSVKPARPWSRRRRLAVVTESLFVVSCLGCAAALWAGRFEPWMAGPLALSYLLMVPLPCYFEPVNRLHRLRAIRNLLFLALALLLFAIAVGFVPLSVLGFS